MKHADVFAKSDNDLGRTNVVEHEIDTGNSEPIRQPPGKIPLAQQSDCDKEVQSMLDKGIVEHIKALGFSSSASPEKGRYAPLLRRLSSSKCRNQV